MKACWDDESCCFHAVIGWISPATGVKVYVGFLIDHVGARGCGVFRRACVGLERRLGRKNAWGRGRGKWGQGRRRYEGGDTGYKSATVGLPFLNSPQHLLDGCRHQQSRQIYGSRTDFKNALNQDV